MGREKVPPFPKNFSLRTGLAVGLLLLGCFAFTCLGISITTGLKPISKPTRVPLVFPTRLDKTSTPSFTPVAPGLTPTVSQPPAGKIVYVCQLFKVQASDQICIINADGTGQRRLTTDDKARHYYPSFAPDGQSVLFSSNMDGNFEIYELGLAGELTRFWQPGIAPEVSPDNHYIAFTQGDGEKDSLWIMERDGSNKRLLYSNGWDPTWSPDGSRILFASMLGQDVVQLMSIRLDGSDLRQVTDLPLLRGRSDWSSDGRWIVTYAGKPWQRELFLMEASGANPRQITPAGGNSQGPSFSPDGQWVTFTAYFDHYGESQGCEIYLMRLDGSRLTRLTDNDYCDWQPRWGP